MLNIEKAVFDKLCRDMHISNDTSKIEDARIIWEVAIGYCKRKLCRSCWLGELKELSIYDDRDGMLTCDSCGVRVNN
jgi:cell fate regulator YaaT (PSP1 superfamily)